MKDIKISICEFHRACGPILRNVAELHCDQPSLPSKLITGIQTRQAKRRKNSKIDLSELEVTRVLEHSINLVWSNGKLII